MHEDLPNSDESLDIARLPSGLSVIIPVYNSAEILPALIVRLESALNSFGLPSEILLIDDQSRDRSWSVISELAKRHESIREIRMMRNYGQHNALLAGIRVARYDTVVTMDDDLQYPPEEIGKLLEKLSDEVDVVYGAPGRQPHGFLRGIASVITKMALQSAMGALSARHVSAFRAFRTDLRRAFETHKSPFISLDVLLTWATTRFDVARVRHDERAFGKSNYSVAKLIRHAVNMTTGFSTLPLQLASVVGFVFSLLVWRSLFTFLDALRFMEVSWLASRF